MLYYDHSQCRMKNSTNTWMKTSIVTEQSLNEVEPAGS